VQKAVDADNLYWTDLGEPAGGVAPGVYSAPKFGTTSTRLGAAAQPAGIAVYQGTVYWADSGTGEIMRFASPGPAVPLSTSPAPGWVVVDSSGVYWVDSGTTILHAPLTGTMVTADTLATKQVAATGIATNGSSVFWVNQGTAPGYTDGAVMKLAK
jgi:hypothetical protein